MTNVEDACLNPIRPEEGKQQVVPVLGESGEVGICRKEDEEAEEEEQNTEEEIRKPKPASRPYTPTQQEIREHKVTHLPFRLWCRHCVSGKGIHSPHPLPDDKDKIGITWITVFKPERAEQQSHGGVAAGCRIVANQ